MKKTLVTLVAASTLAAVVVPAFANSTVGSGSFDPAKYTTQREASEAQKAAADSAAYVQPFVEAERKALAAYNNALEAHNTVVARFQAAVAEYEAAKIEADNVRKNATADLKAQHDVLTTNKTDAQSALSAKQTQLANLDVAGLESAAQTAEAAANTALAAVEAHRLTEPVAGSEQSVIDAYNLHLQALENAANKAVAAAQQARSEADAAAAKATPLALEIEDIKALINDIEYKLNTEVIVDDAAVAAAVAKLAAAETKMNTIAAEMPGTRAALDAAKANLDAAIAANEKAHAQAEIDFGVKLGYTAPEVASAAKTDAEKQAEAINAGAGADKAAGTTEAAKPAAKAVAAAKTATSSKALPKTSAAK